MALIPSYYGVTTESPLSYYGKFSEILAGLECVRITNSDERGAEVAVFYLCFHNYKSGRRGNRLNESHQKRS